MNGKKQESAKPDISGFALLLSVIRAHSLVGYTRGMAISLHHKALALFLKRISQCAVFSNIQF